MSRKALSADEAEFIGNLCHYVRDHLDSFRETGKRLDERFSAAAFQQHHDEQVEGFRRARAPKFDNDLNCQVTTDEPMYSEEFIEAAKAGHVPTLPAHRMGKAMAECASVQADDAVDTELAEIACVLTWLAWDQHANEIQPHICEFQKMEWHFDPLYTDINRRQNLKERVNTDWVTLARKSLSLVKLRPATKSSMMPVVSHENDAQELPHAERWLRDRAHVVAANLPTWRALVDVEEQSIRAKWKAERMMRVRARKRELRLDLERHAELLPPRGKRKTYFREQLRREWDLPDSVENVLFMASRDAIDRARTMFNGRPFTRSFAAWVEFLLFVILSESAGECERVSVLQALSNEWPGRQRVLIDFKHNGVLEQLLKLDARAWVVAVPDQVVGRVVEHSEALPGAGSNDRAKAAAGVMGGASITPATERDPSAPTVALVDATDDLVTLDQAAVLAKLSKRTLERWVAKGELPAPDVRGGGGRPSKWRWSSLRKPLEQRSSLKMPERFPGSRIF